MFDMGYESSSTGSPAVNDLTAIVYPFLLKAGFIHCAMLRIAPVGMTMGRFVISGEGHPSLCHFERSEA